MELLPETLIVRAICASSPDSTENQIQKNIEIDLSVPLLLAPRIPDAEKSRAYVEEWIYLGIVSRLQRIRPVKIFNEHHEKISTHCFPLESIRDGRVTVYFVVGPGSDGCKCLS